MQPFWGLLRCSDSFSGLRELLPTLCTLGVSIRFSSHSGSPMCDTAPLAGKSGVSDQFATVLEYFSMFCMRAHTSDASTWLHSLFGSPTRSFMLM